MLERLGREPGPLQVGGRALVELALLVLRELGAQVVGEQTVEPVPAPLRVERDEEEVGPLGTLEERPGVLATGQLAAQVGREPLGDRRPDQEPAQVGVDLAEHLVGEVVEHEALAARERLDHGRRVGPIPQGDRGELEAGDPTLGSRDETIDKLGLEREARSVEFM